jgi:hypothetical protein
MVRVATPTASDGDNLDSAFDTVDMHHTYLRLTVSLSTVLTMFDLSSMFTSAVAVDVCRLRAECFTLHLDTEADRLKETSHEANDINISLLS